MTSSRAFGLYVTNLLLECSSTTAASIQLSFIHLPEALRGIWTFKFDRPLPRVIKSWFYPSVRPSCLLIKAISEPSLVQVLALVAEANLVTFPAFP